MCDVGCEQIDGGTNRDVDKYRAKISDNSQGESKKTRRGKNRNWILRGKGHYPHSKFTYFPLLKQREGEGVREKKEEKVIYREREKLNAEGGERMGERKGGRE